MQKVQNDNQVRLYQVLKKHFGYTEFRQGQLEATEAILSKRDTLLVLPTSGGKSICYQLPSLLFKKLTLVISPLISLMEDQVREAKLRGRRDVGCWHSGLTRTERKHLLQNIQLYKLLYVSPEALQSPTFISNIKRRGVDLFVVDEAHCISQWGHDFRLDYLRLAEVRAMLGQPTCLALTATATQETQADIIKHLRLTNVEHLVYSVNRENIYIHIVPIKSEGDKQDQLFSLLKDRQDAGIVYCATRAQTEELFHLYTKQGIEGLAYYHGGMSTEERQLIQHQYLHNELKVIFATNAFGMGINKPNIRYVVHYHAPFQLESYVQEMGRCCRDGQQGTSVVFVQEGDHQLAQHFLEHEFLAEEQIKGLCTWLSTEDLQSIMEKGNWKGDSVKSLLPLLQCNEQALLHALFYWEEYVRNHSSNKEVNLNRLVGGFEEYLKGKISERKMIRIDKLKKTIKWLYQEGYCRRKLLTSYFNATDLLGQTKADNCCDQCEPNLELLKTDIDQYSYDRQRELSISEKRYRLWPI